MMMAAGGLHRMLEKREAVDWGNKQIAELLTAQGAGVNVTADKDFTPLDVAIQRKHTETTDFLRKHGGKTGEELKADGE
jgi:ankyrin repeat protein